MKALIHIGTEKTGTTSIQEFLHANRTQLAKQGVGYLKTPGLKNNRKLVTYCMSDDYIDDQVKDLGIAAPDSRKRWKQEFKKEITQEIQSLDPSIHSVIISSEHFHSRFRYAYEVENLFNFLKPFFAEIRILVYLRRQDEMAVSLYSTLCRNGWSRESIFPEYVAPEDHYYNYFEMLERWSSIFDQDNIILRIFERSKLEKRDIISDFIGVSGMITDSADFKVPDVQNESLSSIAQEVLIRFNKSLPKYEGNEPNHLFNYLRGNLIHNLQTNYRGVPKLPTQTEAKRFYHIFHESNQRLAQKYFSDDISFSEDFSRYPSTSKEMDIDKSVLDVIFQTIQSSLQILPPLSQSEIQQNQLRVDQLRAKQRQDNLRQTAMEMYEQANRLHEQGSLEESVLAYRRAIDLQGDIPIFFQHLGDVLTELKRWHEAITAYRNISETHSDPSWVHYCIGYTLESSGDWAEAVLEYAKSFSTAMEGKDSFPDVTSLDNYHSSYLFHYQAGQFFARNQVQDKAMTCLHHCLEFNPDFIPAYEMLINLLLDQDCFDEASKIYLAMGESLCREKKLDPAISAFERSIELNSNCCWSYNCLGNVYHWKGDLDNAIVSYQKAIQLKPDLTSTYQRLGDLYSSKGNIDQATIFYELALKYDSHEAAPDMVVSS